MSSLFDPPIERRGSDSSKWRKFASDDRDVIGAWVADMDLPCADAIIEALHRRVDERVFGYATAPDELIPLVMARLESLYGWRTEAEWFVIQPGVVPSLFFASNCIGKAGDGVMSARPNYHYFLETADHTDRIYQPINCHAADGRWQMDFDQMAETISSRTSTFLLCNPFNPVGRALDQTELETIAHMCLQNQTMICSDEIHAELVLDDHRTHIPIASLDREIEQQSITLFSAAKAFNLPGIGGLSFAVIPDQGLRDAFTHRAYGVATHPGALAYAATLAAYRDGDAWLAETIRYLRTNRDYLETAVAQTPGLSMTHVEATFLAWIKVEKSGIEEPAEHFLRHGLALSDGTPMGNQDYVRLNFGCHRTTLDQIIRRLRTAMA